MGYPSSAPNNLLQSVECFVFLYSFLGKQNQTYLAVVVDQPMNELIPKGPALATKTPLDMFLCHFDMDLIEFLTLEINRQRLVLMSE